MLGNDVKYLDAELTPSGALLSVRMRSAPERPLALCSSSAFIALRAAYADDWPPEERTRIGGGGEASSVEQEESMPAAIVIGCLRLRLPWSSLFAGCTAESSSALAAAPAVASAEAGTSSKSNINSWVVAGLLKIQCICR